VHVVIAPDSFGGTLTAQEAATAIAEGWHRARAADRLTLLPLSDGGEGLIAVLAAALPAATTTTVEVAGPDSRPRDATLLWLDTTTCVIESADICGLALVPTDRRRPLEATTYGVGQALRAAVDAGATRVVVGLGGSATVDGGSGALNALGFRLLIEDGSRLRIGAGDLAGCVSLDRGRSAWPEHVDLVLLADVDAKLADAVPLFGPQKGLRPEQVASLGSALVAWGSLLEQTFPGAVGSDSAGSGAAGGLGLGLAMALGGRIVPGAGWVAEQVGLPGAIERADVVVTGEGRLDATSGRGKVVGHVASAASAAGGSPAVIAGVVATDGPASVGISPQRCIAAPAPQGGPAAHAAVTRAAESLALRLTSVH
jgi:glycerate kinase